MKPTATQSSNAHISARRVNPTWEALVRLKGAMHTNDPKYIYPAK